MNAPLATIDEAAIATALLEAIERLEHEAACLRIALRRNSAEDCALRAAQLVGTAQRIQEFTTLQARRIDEFPN